MDLILKPTSKCNFACTFCSSTVLSEQPKDIVELSEIEAFIKRYPDTRTIIVNGGDPLMMPPKYYWDIIDILDKYKCKAVISMTTNLWGFYKKPEKWRELFQLQRVQIITSFQYGNARLKGDLTPFTEEEYIACADLLNEVAGYKPDFIAVIDRSNEHTVLDTVRLAQRIGVEAKVNHLVASGPEVQTRGITIGAHNKFFTQADMYEHYIAIYDAGLMEWEYNTKQMAKRLSAGNTTCPLSRECDAGIRNLQPGKGYYSCGAFGDDQLYPIDFDAEMKRNSVIATPLQEAAELDNMKESCYTCPMFDICNGCRKTVHDTKRMGLVEYHCKKMKSLAPRIIEINGMTDLLEPTPYVDESLPLIARG